MVAEQLGSNRHKGFQRADSQPDHARSQPLHLCRTASYGKWGRDRLSLCKNFLDLAESWGGYNPKGKDTPDPADSHDGLAIKK